MRIGVDIDSLVETDMMRMQAVFQDKRSLVFGISISGTKESVLFFLCRKLIEEVQKLTVDGE